MQCECGCITGVQCEATAQVLIEIVPEYLRNQHAEARNSGTYPLNGAIVRAVNRACAESLVRDNEGWAEVVGPYHRE